MDMLLATPGTCLYRAAGGDEWTLTDHLLALVHDQLAVANWQRSKDGTKGRNRPKPISPLRKQQQGARMGKTDKSPEQVKALLARYGPQPAPDLGPEPDPTSAAEDASTDDPGR